VPKLGVFLCALALAGANIPAVAAECPRNPDALGTSRVVTLSFDQLSQVGSMQHKGILPLKDHEVVLTFDDGPLPPYTNVILDTLASQCVKATYFVVGQMARSYPYLVRRLYNAGHTVGTHSLDHPLAFERLAPARVKQEVEGGIAYVDAAIGDPRAVAPFFRIPGFKRSNAVDNYLKSRALVNWSADIVPMTGSKASLRNRLCSVPCSVSKPKAAAFCCCMIFTRQPPWRFRLCSKS
jgi:peptidoglycan/xylan/chitin deacetylase (PgdA/CDA1 family)